jgi:hypothetical protein
VTGLALVLTLIQVDTLPAHVVASQLERAGQLDSARQVLVAAVDSDSTYGEAWNGLGLVLLRTAGNTRTARAVSAEPAPTPAVRMQALLDSADRAFARAEQLGVRGAAGYRIFVWGERALFAWGDSGITAAQRTATTIPEDVRVPAILEELAENVLRACPSEGVLLTAREEDTFGALYLWLVRGLRSDLYVVPLAAWASDSSFRDAVARDLGLEAPPTSTWLESIAARRPVCASAWLDRPPEERTLKWAPHPLLWATGPADSLPAVPEGAFVFVALLGAVDAERDPWAVAAVDFYRRAVRLTPRLCDGMAAFGVDVGRLGCES